jgi:translation elongation factor EF-Tu-like GTPase
MTAGQKVEILGLGNTLESVVASVEAFNRTLDRGGQGSGGVRGRFTQTLRQALATDGQ